MAHWLGVLLFFQGEVATVPPPPASPLPTATTVHATRTAEPPVLDGRDDDASGQRPGDRPVPRGQAERGRGAGFRTEARVAYDEHNLYVFVRAFDPHPDSIVSLLSRRDDQTASDYVTVMLDPYHDRRTGYEFSVNPAGVKTDYAIYNDGDEDVAWDAVWDVATRIDSLGWTAEYRIPLSQLHYSAKGGGTFGILVWRVIQRHTATVTWPLYRTSHLGLSSQFGELTGLEGWRARATPRSRPTWSPRTCTDPASAGLRARPGGHRRRRPQVPARLEPAAQRHGQSRLRPGRGRSLGAQPQRRSRPSSTSGGRSSWRARGCSPSP